MQPRLPGIRKSLAVILACLILISVFSVNAFAYDGTFVIEDKVYDAASSDFSSSVNTDTLTAYLRQQLSAFKKTVDLSSFNISSSEFNTLGKLIYQDMPDMFHVRHIKGWQQSSKIVRIDVTYQYTQQQFSEMHAACTESINKILDGIKGNSAVTAEQKLLLVHDRLAVLCEYDTQGVASGNVSYESTTMYGALVNRVAVCQGYAEAYLYILEQLGIESYLCESDALNHVWNIVALGGKEYHVDVTWDDPTEDISGRVMHNNFLRSASGIYSTGHTATDYIIGQNDTRYDNYFWQNSDSEFQLVGNELYYIDETDAKIKKYNGTAVASAEDIWYASGSAYWPGNYSYLASDGKYLLYNKSDAVYQYNPATGKERKLWTPDFSAGAEFHIYGFTLYDGYLICDLNDSPNFKASTKLMYQQQTPYVAEVPRNLLAIAAARLPDKTSYYIGDSFDSTGLILMLVYDNGDVALTDSGFFISSFDSSSAGTKNMTVYYENKTATFDVTVVSPAITVKPSSVTLQAGESATLSAETTPSGMTVSWSSDNSNVTVDSKGKITARADGEAVITAKITYNGKAYAAQTVVNVECRHSVVTYYAAVASTCKVKGHAAYKKCNICGAVTEGSDAPLPLKAHSYADVASAAYLVSAADCVNAAVYKKSCSVCSAVSDKTFEYGKALGHAEVMLQSKAASCTQSGLTEGIKCSRCNEILKKQATIPATGHAYEALIIHPTCTENGYTSHTCVVCGHLYKSDKTEKTGHKAVTIPGKAPTETEAGLTSGEKCRACGVILKKQSVIPALGHSEEIIPARAPTCTEAGLTEGKICSVCNKITVPQTIIHATGHAFESVTIAPTCTEKGCVRHTCKVCGYVTETDEKDPTGHTVEIIPGKNATENQSGLTSGEKCKTCKVILKEQQIIAAKGHQIVTLPGSAPTCTKDGYTDGKICKTCGKITIQRTVIPATGHDYVAVLTSPTCTKEGYTTYVCRICSSSYTADITAAAGHKPVVTEGRFPTAAQGGLTEGEKCSVCNYVIKAQTELPPLGENHAHEYSAAVNAPTCTTDGYTLYTCVCGDAYTADIIAASGHKEMFVAGKAATCCEAGLTDGKVCSICSEVIVSQKPIEAKGHNYIKYVMAATCTEEGYVEYICSICKDAYVAEEMAAAGHVSEIIPAKNPTADKSGLTEGEKCSVCGLVLKWQAEIPATGTGHVHEATQWRNVVAATCSQNGYSGDMYCVICGEMVSRGVVTDKLDHVAGDWKIVKYPSATETGMKQKICYICGDVAERSVIPATGSKDDDVPEKDTESSAEYVKGDVTGDNKITAADARTVLRVSARLETLSEDKFNAADVNKDKKITAADARTILRVSARLQSF